MTCYDTRSEGGLPVFSLHRPYSAPTLIPPSLLAGADEQVTQGAEAADKAAAKRKRAAMRAASKAKRESKQVGGA